MLIFLTLVIMGIVAYANLREGILTAFTACVNVIIAGLVAFNFWEPMADALESMFRDSFLAGCEDALCLILLFGITLGTLRVVTNQLANKEPDFHPTLQRVGGGLLGAVAGYLVAGFLVCVMQTLPLPEDFLGFDAKADPGQGNVIRKVLPPDRVWLGLMQRAGAYALSNEEDPQAGPSAKPEDRYLTFDKYSTFELRYARYRRYNESPNTPLPYLGELDKEIHKK